MNIKKEKLRQIGHILKRYEKHDKRIINKKSRRCPICGIKSDNRLKYCPNCNHIFY